MLRRTFLATVSRRTLSLGGLGILTVLATNGESHAQVGRTWTYADNGGGYFQHCGGNRWTEFVNNDGGVTFHFREISRNAGCVLLYDDSRNLWVRIHQTTSHVRHAGTSGWVFLYYGRWE